jgi:hypothetical protein
MLMSIAVRRMYCDCNYYEFSSTVTLFARLRGLSTSQQREIFSLAFAFLGLLSAA